MYNLYLLNTTFLGMIFAYLHLYRLIGILLLGLLPLSTSAQIELEKPLLLDPNDTDSALIELERLRNSLRVQSVSATTLFDEMIELGMWEEAKSLINEIKDPVALARWYYLQNKFGEAEQILQKPLASNAPPLDALLLRAQLYTEAWELDTAQRLCQKLLRLHPDSPAVAVQLGEVFILQKKYADAIAVAQRVQQYHPHYADAYKLEAKAHFWHLRLEAAEKALRKCLELNPFDADARFNYGYALWRKVDVTLLDDMAAQWEVALAINPLHYLTHWHWGNGHTHLTFADYLDEDETIIRNLLKPADSLLSLNQIDAALSLTDSIAKAFPHSVIPLLYRGSFYYMATDKSSHLDSALQVFQQILIKKPHYGPAHNGLAAVIKAKRFPYLTAYDSLEQVIYQTHLTNRDVFSQVFPAINYYPGERMAKMLAAQLYTSRAYLPMLAKLNRTFAIPPLHIDLALAMKSPYFRNATTFDNRQWMDIRGVGSGATGIEYVERGAHLERNVTLHEYVHLFHGLLFTDEENRTVRKRYYHAMEHNLILDYYSANNEKEYFAQTFPAYFMPIKVHPLNHKSVNIRKELEEKDPLMFQFIDQLVQKQHAFLDGDEQALAENWAQTYLALAREAPDTLAMAYLDTARQWSPNYLPAILQQASYQGKIGNYDKATQLLSQAAAIDSAYPPLYLTHAELVAQQVTNKIVPSETGIEQQLEYVQQASLLETDLMEQAMLQDQICKLYWEKGQLAKALAVSQTYAKEGSTLSTYLRDYKDRIEAFGYYLMGIWGYKQPVDTFFNTIIQLKPQNYALRLLYANVLIQQERYEDVLALLEEPAQLLRVSGSQNRGLDIALAEAYWHLGLLDTARKLIDKLSLEETTSAHDPYAMVRISLLMNQPEHALNQIEDIEKLHPPHTPRLQAETVYMQGCVALAEGKSMKALLLFQDAIGTYPYHWRARKALEDMEADGKTGIESLPLQPGQAFMSSK